jgi:hypothetical protein
LRDRAEKSSRHTGGSKAAVGAAGRSGSPGSGAPAHRRATVALIAVLAAVLVLALVSNADALTQRPYKETFGSAAQPSVGWANTIAVEQRTGDILVGDRETDTIERYHADGTAAPFAALGSNIIDGMEVNGKPCSEEPASCDKTPENGIDLAGGKPEIAIDESGGPTDGDIYITQPQTALVEIFAADGSYLTQLKGPGVSRFPEVQSVAVGPTGTVYVGGSEKITKFSPKANPVSDSDAAGSLELPGPFISSALGSGPSSTSIFVAFGAQGKCSVEQINEESGQAQSKFAEGSEGCAEVIVDPFTHHVLVTNGSVVSEWETPSGSPPVQVGSIRLHEPTSSIQSIAASADGKVIVGENAFPSTLSVYGTPAAVPTVSTAPASGVTGTKATLSGTVEPSGVEVTECSFEYGTTTEYGDKVACEGATSPANEAHLVHVHLSGLLPNGNVYHYRLVAMNANGVEESADRTFETAATVVTEEAAPIGTESATLHGTLRPEGLEYSSCRFEYGPSNSARLESSAPCSPSPSVIEPDFSPHAVSAAVGDLMADATYRYRLTATDSEGTVTGKVATFSTSGPPEIKELRALNADQSSARIEASVDPRGASTRYFIEWGTTASHGSRVPAGGFLPGVGAGDSPVPVGAELTGLSMGSSYHYRFVATNIYGTTFSEDAVLETLNSCGLPEERCLELVSPRDAGPIDLPGAYPGTIELHFQAANRPGGLAYVSETGTPEATKGGEILSLATRGPESWNSTPRQLSPPITGVNEADTAGSLSSEYQFLNEELTCGVVTSNMELTTDDGMRQAVEAGAANLYRQDTGDGSYTGITKLPPTNPSASSGVQASFAVEGASENCTTIAFRSFYTYPGVPATLNRKGSEYLYEWSGGSLQSVAYIPGPDGEVLVSPDQSFRDAPFKPKTNLNVVSADGSRVFFQAQRLVSPDLAEVGKMGLFVRENGAGGRITEDISQSETPVPDEGATFQFASPDGMHAFFLANGGLTEGSSSEGTDLYEYNFQIEKLVDLSPDQEPGGAEVAGFIGESNDGSHVYYAARGQLEPGRGRTLAENKSDHSYSIYGEQNGDVSYVGTVSERELGRVLPGQSQTARVSPDGRYLLFESTGDVTGYVDGSEVPEAYLYDAEMPSEPVVCVSCRQDGGASMSPSGLGVLTRLESEVRSNGPFGPRSLTERAGEPVVFFTSADVLAPGGRQGVNNVYEWAHGQVFGIAAEPAGLNSAGHFLEATRFVSASADGSDLYFVTPETLNWEDGDARQSIYDARIGGGHPQPQPPPAPCDPTKERSCQESTGAPAAAPSPASQYLRGAGNAEKKHHKKKHHKKKHHKKKHHKKKPKRTAHNGRRKGK